MSRHRQRRVHGYAQRTMLLTTRTLRSVRQCPRMDPALRKPLPMDVNRLYRTRAHHQQQARKRQHPQP